MRPRISFYLRWMKIYPIILVQMYNVILSLELKKKLKIYISAIVLAKNSAP